MTGGGKLKDTVSSNVTPDRSRETDIDWIILAGGRLGYSFDRSLLYVKGGYANAQVKLQSFVTSTGVTSGFSNRNEGGWNVGAGWEYAVAKGIHLGIQYDFISLNGSDRFNVNTPAFAPGNHVNVDADIQMVTARLTFLLGRDHQSVSLK